MTTFSNGAEHSMFVNKYCVNCVNRRLDPVSQTMGCPVEDLHILGDGEDYFIQFETGKVATCLMFLSKSKFVN